jgi:type III secretory pathway component EscR
MKSISTFRNIGGLQSLMFCLGIYVVALFFSIFVCSAVFYALYPTKSNVTEVTVQQPAEKQVIASLQ